MKLTIPAAILKNTIAVKGTDTALGGAQVEDLGDGVCGVVSSDGTGTMIAYVYPKSGERCTRKILLDPAFVRDARATVDISVSAPDVPDDGADTLLVYPVKDSEDDEKPAEKTVGGAEIVGRPFGFWPKSIPDIRGEVEKTAIHATFPLATLRDVLAAMYAIEKRDGIETEQAFRPEAQVDIWLSPDTDLAAVIETSRCAAVVPRARVAQPTSAPMARMLRRKPTDAERVQIEAANRAAIKGPDGDVKGGKAKPGGAKPKKRKPAKKDDRCGAEHPDRDGIFCDRETSHKRDEHIAWDKQAQIDVSWSVAGSPAATIPGMGETE